MRSQGNVVMDSVIDTDVPNLDRCAESNGSQSPSMKNAKYSASRLVKKVGDFDSVHLLNLIKWLICFALFFFTSEIRSCVERGWMFGRICISCLGAS